MPEFFKLVSGTLALPIDLPGTNYRQGLQVLSTLSPFCIWFFTQVLFAICNDCDVFSRFTGKEKYFKHVETTVGREKSF